jgi:hypothetical protein
MGNSMQRPAVERARVSDPHVLNPHILKSSNPQILKSSHPQILKSSNPSTYHLIVMNPRTMVPTLLANVPARLALRTGYTSRGFL